jgi:hypothetical protein
MIFGLNEGCAVLIFYALQKRKIPSPSCETYFVNVPDAKIKFKATKPPTEALLFKLTGVLLKSFFYKN